MPKTYLQRGWDPTPTTVLDITLDGEAPVLEIWEMKITPLLALLQGPLLDEMVVPVRILSLG